MVCHGAQNFTSVQASQLVFYVLFLFSLNRATCGCYSATLSYRITCPVPLFSLWFKRQFSGFRMLQKLFLARAFRTLFLAEEKHVSLILLGVKILEMQASATSKFVGSVNRTKYLVKALSPKRQQIQKLNTFMIEKVRLNVINLEKLKILLESISHHGLGTHQPEPDLCDTHLSVVRGYT